jgi:hypothetical protein
MVKLVAGVAKDDQVARQLGTPTLVVAVMDVELAGVFGVQRAAMIGANQCAGPSLLPLQRA